MVAGPLRASRPAVLRARRRASVGRSLAEPLSHAASPRRARGGTGAGRRRRRGGTPWPRRGAAVRRRADDAGDAGARRRRAGRSSSWTTDHLDPDPGHRAAISVNARSAGEVAAGLLDAAASTATTAWLTAWRHADAAVLAAVDELPRLLGRAVGGAGGARPRGRDPRRRHAVRRQLDAGPRPRRVHGAPRRAAGPREPRRQRDRRPRVDGARRRRGRHRPDVRAPRRPLVPLRRGRAAVERVARRRPRASS